MSSTRKVALVTGGNKGIGLAICRALASNKTLPIHVLLGSRDEQRGKHAVTQLKKEGLTVEAINLDITNTNSINNAINSIKQHQGGLDILINNAGIAFKGDQFDEEVCRTTIDTNYYGTKQMIHSFLPLMRENGRIVNISSMAGTGALRKMREAKRKQFLKEDLKEEELDELMEEFINDVKNNQWEEKGWPRTGYGMSKAGVTMLTRILGRDNANKSILINSCCPGWVKTDMAGGAAPLTPDEGAVTPFKLALLPNNSKETGKFWQNEQIRSYF